MHGASIGSSIGQQLVIDHPHRVRKLILESATYSVRITETRILFDLLQATAGNASEPAGVRREAAANLAWDGTWDDISVINKSVMLIVGTGDFLTPQSVAVQMTGQIDGSWLTGSRTSSISGPGSHRPSMGRPPLASSVRNESPLYATV